MTIERLTPKQFAEEIENIVKRHFLSYLDAILYYCEQNDMGVESIPPLLTSNLKQKIEAVAQDLHYLPRSNKLKFQ